MNVFVWKINWEIDKTLTVAFVIENTKAKFNIVPKTPALKCSQNAESNNTIGFRTLQLSNVPSSLRL